MNPFEIEKIRTALAQQNDFKRLRKWYNKKYPIIVDKNTTKFWDELNIECVDYIQNNNPMAMDRVKIVSNLINGNQMNVLNVGFGSASLEERYFNNYHPERKTNWTGIDISRKSVMVAKKKFPYVNFLKGNIRELNLNNEMFDFAICLEVLEHIQPYNLFEALHELYRVLKKNGKLIVSVPLNEGLEELVVKGFNPNGHVRVYTPILIKTELIMAGFKIVNEQYLYAFHKRYKLKKLIVKGIIRNYKKPNNIILVATKP